MSSPVASALRVIEKGAVNLNFSFPDLMFYVCSLVNFLYIMFKDLGMSIIPTFSRSVLDLE